MLILLPPSEGKSAPKRGKHLALADLAFPALTEPREQVITALAKLCAGDPQEAARALGLGPTQTDDVRRNTRLLETPTARADAIYTGVLYEALDLRVARQRRTTPGLGLARNHVLAVRAASGRPTGSRRTGSPAGSTSPASGSSRHTGAPRSTRSSREAAGRGLIVDLRSSTYAAFWRPDRDLASRVATVRVLQQVGSRRMVVSHFNKATKGRLVRALLESGASPRTPVALADVIRDLGWKVELDDPGKHGQLLDVIVEEV